MYEVGKYYTFRFQEKYVGRDGNIYLHLFDPNNPDTFISVKPYSFQSDWEDISCNLECFCYKQDINGQFRFEQSREAMLKYLYGPELGKYNTFFITTRIDDKGKVCCLISDSYGLSQRYYPNDVKFWNKYSVEDEIILNVKGIHPSQKKKNNAYLELESHKEFEEIVVKQLPDRVIHDTDAFSIGEENDHCEFKSSIVFPAGKFEKNMSEQLAVIMKSLAGFMNKDGGTLYIGVNDSGEPFKDIKDEFQYLNDDENDKYTYSENEDHYKLKLNNKIRFDLGEYAATIANVTLKKANGVTYAAIEVKKSDSVIWYRSSELYVRCDNCTRRMHGDNITNFILSRVSGERFNAIVNRPLPISSVEIENETEPSKNVQKVVFAENTVKEKSEDMAWRYISLLSNGQWVFSKMPYYDKNELIMDVAIPKNPKQYVMMIAYKSGRINAVSLKDLLYGTGRNSNTLISCDIKRNGGVKMDGDTIVNAFCMKKKGGIVLMESVENKICRVKAHKMEIISSHQSISAQGNKMLCGGELVRIAPIEAETAEMNTINAMGILVKNHERYSKNGVNKHELQSKYQETLNELLG